MFFTDNFIYFLSNPVGYKHEKSNNYDPNDKWNCLFKITLIDNK